MGTVGQKFHLNYILVVEAGDCVYVLTTYSTKLQTFWRMTGETTEYF